MIFRITILFILLLSCQQEKLENPSECIQCYDYQYQQIVDESSYITVVLDAGIYCLGDYIFQVQNTNQFLEIMNDSLLNLITSNGYCEYITNNDS